MSNSPATPAAPGDRPPRREGKRPWLDLTALILSAGALAVSAAGYFVADRADDRQQRREEAECAQRIVYLVEERVSIGIPGGKPTIDGSTVVVVNFGSFPVEDVVIEQSKRPSVLLVDTVPAIRIGTLGPCQVATFETDEVFERVFVDVNVTWSRKQASPPHPQRPDADVERSFPDIRQGLPLEVADLEQCR